MKSISKRIEEGKENKRRLQRKRKRGKIKEWRNDAIIKYRRRGGRKRRA